MRARRILQVLAAVVVVLALTTGSQGFSGGRSDRAAGGCGGEGCHGVAPDPSVIPVIEGLPEKYVPGEMYVLNVTLTGARDPLPAAAMYAGGFALGATDGALSVAPGDEAVQIGPDRNATQTEAGAAARVWTVVWTAPPPTGGAVTFHLSVNAVNGNAAPDPLDQWNTILFAVEEGDLPEPPTRRGPNASHQQGSVSDPFPENESPGPGLLLALAAAGLVAAARLRA